MTRYSRRVARANNPQILRAARELSKKLKRQSVKHAIIGGLAVGMYGYERATHDADFLISTDSMDLIAGTSLGGEVHGKTIVFKNVVVDILFPDEDFLESALRRPVTKRLLPIIPLETLICMKLMAGRMKDSADVVELLKRGKVNVERTVRYLENHRPDLTEDFEAILRQSKIESE